MLSDGPSMPKPGLLVLLLGLILLEDDFVAPEEEVWGALSKVGVCAGRQHYIYGEPRELLTKVWVQEGYLEYRQVPHSDPARYEFLWGPRAYAETSKWLVLEHLLRVNGWDLRSFLSLCAEGVSDEEEGAPPQLLQPPGSIPALQHWRLSLLSHLPVPTQRRTALVMNLNSFETCPLTPQGKFIPSFWIIEI